MVNPMRAPTRAREQAVELRLRMSDRVDANPTLPRGPGGVGAGALWRLCDAQGEAAGAAVWTTANVAVAQSF